MSKLWNKAIHFNLFLDKIYRQTDHQFQNMLNKIRIGEKDNNIGNATEM